MAAPGDLPQARQAGFDQQAPRLAGRVVDDLGRDLRPGADDGHVAPEHVEQLGEFVEAALPDEPPHAGDPRIIADLEGGAGGLVHVGQLLLADLCVHDHGAELEAIEIASVLPHPALAEKQRAGRVELDQQAEERKERQDEDQPRQGAEQIDQPLGQQIDGVVRRRRAVGIGGEDRTESSAVGEGVVDVEGAGRHLVFVSDIGSGSSRAA